MKLHPKHDRHSLTKLRGIAATPRGRRLLQGLLDDYRLKRPAMPESERAPHDIAAARVQFALAERARPGGAPPDGGLPMPERAA